MKYTKKMPVTDKNLSLQLQTDGWIKLKEPGNLLTAILFSFPLMLILSAVTVWVAYLIQPELFDFFKSGSLNLEVGFDLNFIFYIFTLLVYMYLHEMIHAIFIPNFIRSDRTYWGINGIGGFVFTTEPINKFRFIIISIMPFTILSIIAVLLFHLIGMLNWYTLSLCIINAAGSCVDMLNAILIYLQVKSGNTIINNGFETYYSTAKWA